MKHWTQFGSDPAMFLQTFLQSLLETTDGISFCIIYWRGSELFRSNTDRRTPIPFGRMAEVSNQIIANIAIKSFHFDRVPHQTRLKSNER